jgi:hypothetical protein
MLKRRRDRDDDLELANAGIQIWRPTRRGPPRIYKNRSHRGPKKAPKCVACFPDSCAGQRVTLPYGVSLVLCAEHRNPRFIASDSGRGFLAALADVYDGLGLTARRYSAALRRFCELCATAGPGPRHRPGSYHHAARRQAAEQVWAGGGTFRAGLAAALANPPPATCAFRPPSLQTLRRWWRQRRWERPPVGRRVGDVIAPV